MSYEEEKQDRKIEQLEAEIERLRSNAEQYERCIEARLGVIDQQAARIQELEDAHKRSGVKYAKIINELRSSVYANTPGLKKQWDEILNTSANGKVGPDANPHDHIAEFFRPNKSPAKSWQITDERIEALKQAAHTCHEVTAFDIAKVLRAMLEEAISLRDQFIAIEEGER